MDDYSLLHFLDKKLGPFSVRGWMLVGSLAWYGYSIATSLVPKNVRDAQRITSRAASWRGISTEIAEAIVEPLADRLVGALMRRGAFVVRAKSDPWVGAHSMADVEANIMADDEARHRSGG